MRHERRREKISKDSHLSSITISTTPTPYAILDLHFSPHDPTLLAVAGSTGCLQLFRFSSATTSLEPLSTYQFFDPATLVLSLSWHPTQANLLGVTVSEGGVYVVDADVASDTALDTGKEVLTHDLEAWTLVFAHDGKAIYSGGDDASLRFSTLPDPTTSSSSFSPSKTPEEGNKQDEENGEEDQEDFTPLQWQDRRSHQAGVTAILPLASENNILITGSYDDNIRILHAPLVGRKQVLCEENLEGGVWRLKLLKEETEQKRYVSISLLSFSKVTKISWGKNSRYTILASCMHAGARIVQIRTDEEEQWGIEVLAKFEEHKSMNYGSDAQPRGSGNGEDGGKQTIVSTSFYDKLLCLWRF
jgi:diphthamide biosynthesis protein 7